MRQNEPQTERNEAIFEARCNSPPETYASLARRFGITVERVRQVYLKEERIRARRAILANPFAELSARARNVLAKYDIKTRQGLLEFQECNFQWRALMLRWENAGPKTVNEVAAFAERVRDSGPLKERVFILTE